MVVICCIRNKTDNLNRTDGPRITIVGANPFCMIACTLEAILE